MTSHNIRENIRTNRPMDLCAMEQPFPHGSTYQNSTALIIHILNFWIFNAMTSTASARQNRQGPLNDDHQPFMPITSIR